MKLHTVFITYNRLELTKQAIESYLETVSVPHTFCVVDNGSTDGTQDWLYETLTKWQWMAFSENRYPGSAANRGWSHPNADVATHLHRADNDFAFLPGWCEEVERVFKSKKIGQVGLRTGQEEQHGQYNVGGNCVIRRELWDMGLRYDERPWPQLREEVGAGHTEDSLFSPAVKALGYTWARVKKPCIVSLAREDPNDPYYEGVWRDRGIFEWARDSYE